MKTLQAYNVFEAYTNSDLTEGRGYPVTLGFFVKEVDAIKASLGKGVMGTDASVCAKDLDIRIFETFEEYQNYQKDSIRRKALAKLSLSEKQALGLA
jgi:hypothetical protein